MRGNSGHQVNSCCISIGASGAAASTISKKLCANLNDNDLLLLSFFQSRRQFLDGPSADFAQLHRAQLPGDGGCGGDRRRGCQDRKERLVLVNCVLHGQQPGDGRATTPAVAATGAAAAAASATTDRQQQAEGQQPDSQRHPGEAPLLPAAR